MKIGIVTFWESTDNYGQQLQCWALQQQLKKMGHTPYLIRYSMNGRFYVGIKGYIKKIIQYLKDLSDYSSDEVVFKRKSKIRNFESFKKNNIISTSRVYYTLAQLQQAPPEADAYIVGSDQVWAALLSEKNNEVYFLNFGLENTIRVSYAASISMQSYPEELLPLFSQNLKRFNAISVREKSNIEICKKAGFDAKMVLDPTLLLNVKDYDKLNIVENKDKYILNYFINVKTADSVLWDELLKVSNSCGYTCKTVISSGYFPGSEFLNNTEYLYPTVAEWIGLIRNAEIVMTTSFHGIVFCILYHKNFVYIPISGAYGRGNNRVEDLLHMLNLKNRMLIEGKSYTEIINLTIDWELVDNIIFEKRKESIKFLEECLYISSIR